MAHPKTDGNLIRIGVGYGLICALQHQKAGIVLFIGFYTFRQNFHLVQFSSQRTGNGAYVMPSFLADVAGRQRSIFSANQLNMWVLAEKIQTLFNGNRVGVDFSEVFNLDAGKHHEILLDPQVYLPNGQQIGLIQEFIVAHQATSQRVFNGHQSGIHLLTCLQFVY